MVSLVGDKEAVYSRIESEEDAECLEQHERQRTISWNHATQMIALIGCALVTFMAGRYTSHMSLYPAPISPVPSIPMETVTFQPDRRFSGPSSHDSDIAWTTLMPPGEGFVTIQNPEQYGLPPGKNSTASHGSALYDISAFHQLHCLTKIREHVSLLRYAASGGDGSDDSVDRAWEKVLKPQENHMGHCFDYLRQGIMCAGDMTLEWPKQGSEGIVDGWGVQHECKSWDAILSYVDQHGVQ
ncbi:Putative mycotoxin biosynthesis protein UstYa [Septoria linicola]|uniref:Mycotoxin biosynthesis protein UstYa n=1 Tax=Septoria linicola TaxID=215465 RepID=A0A9Q9EJE0_9PEZI|nr:Putative mycotoxin biosynthesis protein UstYa [Septoria linicola]